MKILFIGNSFSEDASRYVEAISDGELFVTNLYIGGCSLEMHADNVKSGKKAYEYRRSGEFIEMCSIEDALKKEEWDYVSLQQVSGYSGIPESYEPYINEVIDFVKRLVPNAKLVFHKTWAYESDSEHPSFSNYNNDRALMYRKITETTAEITKKYSLPVIPSGDVVEAIRSLSEFSGDSADRKITRDGFHLSYDYGRYAAGLTVFKFFTGKRAQDTAYLPPETNTELIGKLRKIVDSIL